jgi:curved DNA-binding protein CbpA
MNLNKLKMTYAALMLAVLFLCIAEWGSCFSSPPKDSDGNPSNSEDKEYSMIHIKRQKEFQKIGEQNQVKNYEENYDASICFDPFPWTGMESFNLNNTSSNNERVKRSLDYLGKNRKDRVLDKTEEESLNPSYDTFRDLRKDNGFIDKTKFILKFHKGFSPVFAILRPRRTGKSMCLKMLKEFYCLPSIDFASYDPETRKHSNSTFTAKSTFENTFVLNSTARKEAYEDEDWKKESDLFIIDNMNQWPVIFVDMLPMKLSCPPPSLSEIQELLSTEVIKKTFKEHEDVLYALMIEEACDSLYGDWSKNSYQRLIKDLRLDNIKNVKGKIRKLWKRFGKGMDPDTQEFYRLYKGKPPYKQVSKSLRLLSEILHDFYDKQVIVLVDEHDTPAMRLYSNSSLDNPEGNAEIITSIHCYAKTIADLLENSCKSNEFRHKFLM